MNTHTLPAALRAIHRIDAYFGAWAIEPQAAAGLLRSAECMDVAAHREAYAAGGGQGQGSQNAGSIAVIALEGPLMKQASSFAGTSTVRAKQAIRQAAADPDIAAILLKIDSPGGTVAGTQELADAIRAANGKKPVWAFVEDLCASAAYWAASQCDRIYANTHTALVGSIGTIMTMTDSSGKAKQDGIEAVVIATGPMKGMGTPGAPISADQRANALAMVQGMQANFSKAVAAGRQLPLAKVSPDTDGTLATGEVFLADEAVGNRLIDGIANFDQTLLALSKRAMTFKPAARAETPFPTGDADMAKTQPAEQTAPNPPAAEAPVPVPAAAPSAEGAATPGTPAPTPPAAEAPATPAAQAPAPLTPKAIRDACPGADSDFVLQALEGDKDLNAIRSDWMGKLSARVTAAEAESTRLRSEAAAKVSAAEPAAPARSNLGQAPASDAGAAGGATSHTAAWNALVSKHRAAGCRPSDAVAKAKKEAPDTYAGMMAEVNGR